MNRPQATVLGFAAANLVLILAFPPYDYLSLAQGFVPTFGGFHFVGAPPPNSVLNHNFLALEELVVLVNTGTLEQLNEAVTALDRRYQALHAGA